MWLTGRHEVALGLVLSIGVLFLAGCGGGFDVLAPAPGASSTAPLGTPVSQAPSEANASPSQGVYTEFDGEDIRVHVVDNNEWSTWRSSVLHAKQSSPVRSRLADHSKHVWTLSGPSTPFDDGRAIVVGARWHDDNTEDYLAGGWWFREVSNSSDSVFGYEAAAFIDGPELRGDLPESISLPLKGQATYRGEAAGHYESVSEVGCVTFPCPGPPTGRGTGEFSADAALWADFAHGTIEGCVGCQGGIEMTPTRFDSKTGVIERYDSFSLNYLLWLHTGSFLKSPGTLGTFGSDMSAIAHTGLSDDGEDGTCAADDVACQVEAASGATVEAEPSVDFDAQGRSVGGGLWQGRFSNVEDEEGAPRLIGATLEGRFDYNILGDAVFTGYVTAESAAFGGRDADDDERLVRENKRILYTPARPVRGTQAPFVGLDDTLHVGADVAPPASQLAADGDRNGIAVSSGWVQDGVGVDRVFEYLQEHMNLGEFKNAIGLEGYSEPPVVRISEGTNEAFTQYVVRAVQLINAALPYDKRVVLSTISAPALSAIEDVPDGQIFIDFAPWVDWNVSNKPAMGDATAIAQPDFIYQYNYDQMRWEIQETRASHIWVDTNEILDAWVFNSATRQWEHQVLDRHVNDTDTTIMWKTKDDITRILAHELLHTLGFGQHIDPRRFKDSSIMNVDDFQERIVHTSNGQALLYYHNQVPGHILFPLDREALFATYNRLEPGLLPEEFSLQSFGPWDDTSFHLLGDMSFPGGDASFGVGVRNGFAQPWASGSTPGIDLADNPSLLGSATWNGALLGITPSSESVTADARLNVDLADLDGQLDFTSMEQWGVNAAPGASGSGAVWGDGDLGYMIAVRDNGFIQTGGDDGEVTGAFFGAAHEAMGGVLERVDLAAGFGGTR